MSSRAPTRTGCLIPLLTCSFGLLFTNSATGLTIVTHFIPEGGLLPFYETTTAPAPNTAGGGSLQDLFQAAARAWERVILDNFALTIHFGWSSEYVSSSSGSHFGLDAGGDPPRQLEASIAFQCDNADRFRFFLDPTPELNEEFGGLSVRGVDFGGVVVETLREYFATTDEAAGSIDLYSTAIHEIGHALGLSRWSFYRDETDDGDIDVVIEPFAGTTLPVDGRHLMVYGPAMSNLARPLGRRREITQTDLLAVCQVSKFTDCVLDTPGDFDRDGVVTGLDFLVWQRGESPNPLSPGDLSTWQASFGFQGAPQSGESVVVHEPHALILACLCLAAVLSTARFQQRLCEFNRDLSDA